MSESTSFVNQLCRRCREPLQRLSAEDMRRQMTKQYVPLQPVDTWNLADPRYEGWWVEFIFHGRREHTPVIRVAARLGGTARYPKDDPTPAMVTAIERPSEWEGTAMDCILGVRPVPPGGAVSDAADDPNLERNTLRVGSFLVFGDRDRRGGAEIQLPIAHLAVWFDNQQIDCW